MTNVDVLKREVLDKQIFFWQKKLRDIETLNLPVDYARPAQADGKGKSISFIINEEAYDKLKNLAVTHECVLSTIFLGGFYILLHKYTSQVDLVIGLQLNDLFHNAVLRQALSVEQTTGSLIGILRNNLIESQYNQDIAFEDIVSALNIENDLSRHPIFQIMFKMKDNARAKSSCIKVGDLLDQCKPANIDLILSLSHEKEEVNGCVNYSESLFNEETIVRFIKHYQNILEQLLDDKTIKEYQILTKEESQEIRYVWNQTAREYPVNKTIYQLFQEQSDRLPNNVAVVFEDKQLTYKELNDFSNQLARYIRKTYKEKYQRELLPDTLITICLDRSIEMIIAILAILKSGGAYVPIDPSYPEARIKYILEDTKSDIILTQAHLRDKLNNIIGYDVDSSDSLDKTEERYQSNICPTLIALDERPYQEEKVTNLSQYSQSADLAYVIYTSGTTGLPKGVMIEQKGLVFSICGRSIHYQEKVNNCLLLPVIAFDSSITAIFWPLLQNGTLTIPTHEALQDVAEIARLISFHKITHIQCVPTLYAKIISQHLFHDLTSLKLVIVAGEPCPLQLVQLHSQLLPNTDLVNEYGPTETSVWSTSGQMYSAHDKKTCHKVTIGSSAPNAQNFVLNEQKQLVPISVCGELYIGGDGVGRGYLNKPELTEERFILNPFATEEDKAKGNNKLYKTNDLVRWLPDGDLEYIGRNDFQVKINGFRIELSEIENALSGYPAIIQAAVVIKEQINDSGNSYKYLVAYYVSDKKILEDDLISYMQRILPNYMIPRAFSRMNSFPLNNNGKVDRKALLEMNFNESAENYIAPRDEIEHTLCEIWQDLLGLKRVGVEDNFFALGGNSILCLQIVNKVKEHFDIYLPPEEIYTRLTISSISKILSVVNNKKNIAALNWLNDSDRSFLESLNTEEQFSAESVRNEKIINTKYGNVWTALITNKAGLNKVPIVFVHGGPSASHDYLRHLLPLHQDRPLLFFDQLGGGRSDIPDISEISDFDIFVNTLSEVIDHYGFSSYYLFGDCLGCSVIVKYCSNRKKGLEGLILSSPSVSAKQHADDIQQAIKRMPQKYQEIINAHIERKIYQSSELMYAKREFEELFILPFKQYSKYLWDTYTNVNNSFWERTTGNHGLFFESTGSLKDVDVTQALHNIDVPVLITYGENDFVSESHKEILKENIKNLTVATFLNCSHWPHIQKTNEYIEVLNRFLTFKMV